jgi:hypothetical protein
MDIRKDKALNKAYLDAIIKTSTATLNDSLDQELTKDKLNYTLFQLKGNILELTQCVKELTDAVDKLEEAS